MKVVVVALLLLVAVFARAEDNLQYEQAAYQDSAAEASEQGAEQQLQLQAGAEAEAEAEAEGELDTESQAVAEADAQEAQVEMAEDAEEAQAQAQAEDEMEEDQQVEADQEQEAEGEQEQEEAAFAEVQSDAERPHLKHPGKTLSALAHKVEKKMKNLRAWVAKRQGKGGVAPPPRPNKKPFPRRLPAKPVAQRRASPLKPRPAGVKPAPRPQGSKKKSKGLKGLIKKVKKAARKIKAAAKKAAKKAKSPLKKLLAKLKKKLAKRKERKAARALRPWARKPVVVKKAKVPKRKRKLIKRPPPPPSADNEIWHSERWVAKEHDANADPEMAKLNLALAAVKEDILATNKQINDERRWSIAVHKIVTSYKGKLQRVDAHIIALRKEMKALYRKKKQIENLKLQRALETKLKEARAELKLLTNSLKHVAIKQGQLNRSGADLRQTIAGIQGQLAKLRGQSLFKKKKCGRGKRYSKSKKRCVKRKSKKGKGKGKKGKSARKLRKLLRKRK